MIFEVVKESAKGALVKRGQEMIGEVISSGLAADATQIQTAGFSVGATALIAVTSGMLGGLAGWALHDMFSSPKRSSR